MLYHSEVSYLRGKEITNKILSHLKKLEWPETTENIGKAVGVTWITAQIHLFKLANEGKIKYRKVGRQNQWWLEPTYRAEFGTKKSSTRRK